MSGQSTSTDVVVVGAGIAGLTAALRLRRPEVQNAAPASVIMLEAGQPGGLLAWKRWRNYHITGPRYCFRQGDWEALIADAQALGITIQHEAVIRADLHGEIKILYTEDGMFTGRAVVLAPGMYPLRNAGDFDREAGILTAFGTAEHVHSIVAQRLDNNPGQIVALWGPEEIQETARALADLDPLVVIEPPYSGAPLLPGAYRGTVERLLGTDRVQGLEFRNPAGNLCRLECHCVFLDFKSYMATTNTTRFLEGSGLVLENGFIPVTRDLGTNLAGVFAAGDVTGGMFALAKSIYEGNRAGFAALRYLHHQRFGAAPSLYPFFHP